MRIAGQQGEAGIVHLFQMKDAFDADKRHEDAGQETALQETVLIGETLLGDLPPAEHLGEQQEGARILGLAKTKAPDGRGTGKPERRGWSSASSRARSSVAGSGVSAGVDPSSECRSNPYFLR
jgi:hypothetical protein